MHGSTGIVYQKSLGWSPRAWSDLWDARLAGKLTMLDDPPEVFAACLKTLGYSLNSSDPGQLKAAQQRAIAQKPLVRAYLNAEVRDQLVAGDVAAAQAWAVTAAQAIAAASERSDGVSVSKLAFSFPSEGFPRYADNVAILRESSRQEAAHRFIDYLLRPRVAAAIVETTRTAACNGAAQQFLARRAAIRPGALSAGRNPGARRMVRPAIGRRAAPARPLVDRNQDVGDRASACDWCISARDESEAGASVAG